MTRFFNLLAACIAVTLVLGFSGCKKDEEKADEKAGEAAEKAVDKTTAAAEEKKEAAEATGEAKEAAGEAAAGAVTTGIEECDKLIETYMKCDKLPQQSRDAFLQGAQAWKTSIETGGDAAKQALTDSCKQAAEASKQALAAVGCQ
jgi:hypothetical protein